jgi:hypothetical protein
VIIRTSIDAPADAVRRLYGTVAGIGSAGPQDLLDALTVLHQVRDQLDRWEPTLIGAARAGGVTWSQLAPALGLSSRQAAERRYLRLNPSAADEPGTTREHRVDATRQQRAGDRAVAAWARENAAMLRQLAGQIGGIADDPQAGIDAATLAAADRVRTALGGNDAADLVGPLTAAGPLLALGNPALADRIAAVTAATDQVRTADRPRRGTPRRADRPS